MQGQGDNRSLPAQQRIADHGFATSNSTSNHFLGVPQRSWMTANPPQTSPAPASAPGLSPFRVKESRKDHGSSSGHKERVLAVGKDRNSVIRNANGKATSGSDPWPLNPQNQPQPHQQLNPDLPNLGSSDFARSSSSHYPESSDLAQSNRIPSLQTSEDGLATIHAPNEQSAALHPPVRTSPTTFSIGLPSSEPSIPGPPHASPCLQSLPFSAISPPIPSAHWLSFANSQPLTFSTVEPPPNMTSPIDETSFPRSCAQTSQDVPSPAAVIHPQSPPLESPVSVSGATGSRKRAGQPVVDVSNKRSRPSISQPAQVPTPTSTPVLPNQHHPYFNQLQHSLDRLSQHTTLTVVEMQRSDLLKQACKDGDMFFIVLHQLYSLAFLQQESVIRLGFGAAEMAGLNTLAPILVSNDNLSRGLLDVFANFPNSPDALFMRESSRIVESVKDFLVRLGRKWHRFLHHCLRRGFPSCCEEIVYCFSLFSPVMRKTLFISIERQIANSQNLPWSEDTLRLFDQSQERWSTQAGQPGFSIEQILPIAIQNFGLEYRNILPTRGIFQPTAPHAANRTITSPTSQHSPRILQDSFHQTGISNPQTQNINPYYAKGPHHGAQSNAHSNPRSPAPFALPSQDQMRNKSMLRAQHRNNPSGGGVVPSQSISSAGPQAHSQNTSRSPHSQTSRTAPEPPLSGTVPTTRQGLPPSDAQAHQTTIVSRQASSVLDIMNRRSSIPGQDLQRRVAAASIATSRIGPIQGHFLDSFVPSPHSGLLPPPGYFMAQTTEPNVGKNALHQIHLGSPPPAIGDDHDGETKQRLYAYSESFVLLPQRVERGDKFVVCNFEIPAALLATMACRRTPPANELPDDRLYKSGCTLVRLKCSRRLAALADPDPAEFSEMSISWPSCAFVSLNDNQDIEFRRKLYWGRDLGADLTDLVTEGTNKLTLSYHSVSLEEKDAFYMAVEIVRVSDTASTCALAQSIPKDAVLSAIVSHLNIDQDEDISFADPSISIDLIDPFMAKIWRTPVRGVRCKHRECFDLEAFLLSRSSRHTNGPTDPDRWTCPICSRDARPHQLRIDQFLVSVRAQLEADSNMETRAIIVKQDGTWEAKKEPVTNDERGAAKERTNGTKSKSTSLHPETVGGHDSSMDIAVFDAGENSHSRSVSAPIPTEVIEIQDDD